MSQDSPDEEIVEGLEEMQSTQIYMALREQNVELLRLASEVTGLTGESAKTPPADLEKALRQLWDVYSEFYSWVDPQDAEDDMGVSGA